MVYFVAEKPTPIFNMPDLRSVFGGKTGSLPFDEVNLVRELEMVAFSGTGFEIVSYRDNKILEVKTEVYPARYSLFIDRRFGATTKHKPPPIKNELPHQGIIMGRMRSCVGLPYIWGGNISQGVPEIKQYYPPPMGRKLSKLEEETWEFRGLDCSGLLYEATEGVAPRNTSELLFFGHGISIEGKKADEIIKMLKPLDLVIYRGHVFIVLNEKEVIESKHEFGGVTVSQTTDRLYDFMTLEGRKPVDDPQVAYENETRFLVRRFVT